MNPNLDIESQGELSLGDSVWISGALIFVALMCFCIVLLAHGAKESAMTQAQGALSTSTGAAGLQPRFESNREEAPAESVTALTLPERPVQSSSEVLSQQIQPTLSRDARDELAMTNPRSAKAIRGNQSDLAVTRRATSRRSAGDKSVRRSFKKLIKMLVSNLGRVERH
jgi:hypothetical protein